MDIDYYSLLGVPENADPDQVKRAFKKQALRSHPDLGGSHEEMVLLNQAWLILSDPVSRRHYDYARANRDDFYAQHNAEKDQDDNRKRAENYPSNWEDFRKWFNDIETTDLMAGISIPAGGESFSQRVFVVAGAIGGFLVAVGLASEHRVHSPGPLVMLLLSVGAWTGAYVHHKMK